MANRAMVFYFAVVAVSLFLFSGCGDGDDGRFSSLGGASTGTVTNNPTTKPCGDQCMLITNPQAGDEYCYVPPSGSVGGPNGPTCIVAGQCANGLREGTELCDGTDLGGQTCSSVGAFTGGTLACASGCGSFVTAACTVGGTNPPVNCPNRVIDTGESCDDGNATAGDGCSAACGIEAGWTCVPSANGSICFRCGDGLQQSAEACDDGNATGGDGCSSTCSLVETGYTCPTPGQLCVRVAACGDGAIQSPEICDDRNTTAGDGCSTTCTIETGFVCPTAGSPCTPVCGDGMLKGTETCDDRNTVSGDGCTSGCAIETGYTCPTPGALCVPNSSCDNDRIVDTGEQCDDQNSDPADGCDACKIVYDCHTAAINGTATSTICSQPNCGTQVLDKVFVRVPTGSMVYSGPSGSAVNCSASPIPAGCLSVGGTVAVEVNITCAEGQVTRAWFDAAAGTSSIIQNLGYNFGLALNTVTGVVATTTAYNSTAGAGPSYSTVASSPWRFMIELQRPATPSEADLTAGP